MATSNTLVDMNVKPTVVNYGAFTVTETVKDEKGNTSERVTIKATMSEKALATAKEAGTLLFEQSFSYDIPGTVAGLSELNIPEEEIVNIFRQGLVAKVGRGIVAAMQEQDEEGNPVFQPVEGNFDARGIAAEISGRRGLTEQEKALKTLKNLPADIIAQYLASIQAQAAPQ